MERFVYTKDMDEWLIKNADVGVFKNKSHFAKVFNAIFNTDRDWKQLKDHAKNSLGVTIEVKGRGRRSCDWTKHDEDLMLRLQKGEYYNLKDLTDQFNEKADKRRSSTAIHVWLDKRGLAIESVSKKRLYNSYTEEMRQWLLKHFEDYKGDFCVDFVSLSKDFNAEFGTKKSNCVLAKYCERNLKIHKPVSKKAMNNKGAFKKNGKCNSTERQLPVGTIRYNSDGRPYIKVKLCEGDSGGRLSHNYKEPWWKSLQKKIWEDNYGEVPEGYRVVSLNGNPCDTNIENIGLIDSRGTAVMAKKRWWTENSKFTKTGVQWCNLYYTARDNGVEV